MIINLILNFVNCTIRSSSPAHCHPEIDPASSRHYSSSWVCHFPAHQSHHGPLLLLISLCLIRSLLQERQLSITPCHSGGTTSSLCFNRLYHIEDNVQLGWGEKSWGSKFLLLMLSYFGNLVAFCLILKFLKVFYSTLHGY